MSTELIQSIAQIGSSITTAGLLLVWVWLERNERMKIQAMRDSEQAKQIEWLIDKLDQK